MCTDDELSTLFEARVEVEAEFEVEGEALLLLNAKVRLEVKALFTPFEEEGVAVIVFEVVVDEEELVLPLLEALIELEEEASLGMEVLNVEAFLFSPEVF